jgi:hypothetical protein
LGEAAKKPNELDWIQRSSHRDAAEVLQDDFR